MSEALILAHSALSHAQAIEVCRREGLRIVQTKRGNFIYEPSTPPTVASNVRTLCAVPPGAGGGAGPPEAA